MNSSSNTSLGTLLAVVVGEPEPLADVILARLRDDGYEVITLAEGDAAALQAAVHQTNGLDALVTITPTKRSDIEFDAISDEDFEAALQAQLLSVVRVAQSVLPHLRTSGRIVHVGSRGHQGAWGGAHYMAASAALVALTRSMALELEPEGYCVNLVTSEFSQDRKDTAQNRQAVAHAVSMLAAPHAGITGQCMVIDGLVSLRLSEARRPRFPQG